MAVSLPTLTHPIPDPRQRGFTLLELMVVLVLVSIMMAVTVPNFRNALFTDPLKRSARQTIGLINEARLRALDSEKGCFLSVRFEERQFELDCPESPQNQLEETGQVVEAEEQTPEMTITLPDPVSIESIWNHRSERLTTGEATLWINPDGLMEPCIINLGNDNRQIGLEVSPFLSEIEIADRSLEPETLGDGS